MSSSISHNPILIDGIDYDGIVFIHVPKTAGVAISQTFVDIFGDPDPAVDTHRLLCDLVPKIDVTSLESEGQELIENGENFWKFMVARDPWSRCVSWLFWHRGRGTDWKLDDAIDQVLPLEHYGLDEMDFVLQFSRLQQDIFILCDKLSLPRRALYLANASQHEIPSRYFSDSQLRRVTDKFWAEIYKFKWSLY